jgi:signal transduction histidine kinase
MQPLIVLVIVLFGFLYSFLAYQTWRENSLYFRKTILLLSITLAWLSFTYALELLSSTVAEMSLLNDLEYISYAAVPTFFLFFTLAFSGRDHLVNRNSIILALLVPIFIIISVWTNDLHHLFYISVNQAESMSVGELMTTKGPIYYVYIIYNYFVLTLAVAFLVKHLRDAPENRLNQSKIILVACLIPAVGVVLQFIGVITLPMGFVVTLGYYISGVIFYLGAFRTEVFVIVPVASTTIVDNMSDAAIASDLKGRIVRVNPSAEKLLVKGAPGLLGKDLEETLPGIEMAGHQTSEPMLINKDGEDHYYHIQISPLNLRTGTRIGTLFIFRDITELEKAKEELKMANTKLNLISNITRHDMLNQLVVVRGFSNLLTDAPMDKSERYLRGINSAVITMEHLIDFARDYQRFGLESPVWDRLDNILVKAKVNIATDLVSIVNMDPMTEVHFDQLLERVFYNLFDNSLRHGGKVSRIVIGTDRGSHGLKIIYEDNGIGIPRDEKEMIFQWGFGKNSGLGLAMCQQILTLSGWTIIENGEPGKGAHFEISVPDGDWRVPKAS